MAEAQLLRDEINNAPFYMHNKNFSPGPNHYVEDIIKVLMYYIFKRVFTNCKTSLSTESKEDKDLTEARHSLHDLVK